MIGIAAALREVVVSFERHNVRYVVVGSLAAASWGVVRSTRDADVVALVDSSLLSAILAELDRDVMYVPEESARSALAVHSSFNVIHFGGGGKVDIFLPPFDDAFTLSRLERRRRHVVLGVSAWVASAEDVLLAKLRWRLESRSELQWRDCVEIAAVNDLDLHYLNAWAERLGVASDLADLSFR